MVRFLMKQTLIHSEKAKKFCKIFPLLLTTVHTVKSKGKISQNFVAFSEYMNFIVNILQCICLKDESKIKPDFYNLDCMLLIHFCRKYMVTSLILFPAKQLELIFFCFIVKPCRSEFMPKPF